MFSNCTVDNEIKMITQRDNFRKQFFPLFSPKPMSILIRFSISKLVVMIVEMKFCIISKWET